MGMFGPDIAAALPELRAHAESRMLDTCAITRPGDGVGPWNPATREYDPAEPVTVYEGRCEVQEAGAQERGATAGESDLDLKRYIVKVPVADTAGIRPDDDVRITSAANDPDLLDRHFTVEALHHKTFATARRLPCVEVM